MKRLLFFILLSLSFPMAYNAFSWHLVDCYADKGDKNKATDKKDKVLKNNLKDDDMSYRNRFYDVLFKIEHLTTTSDYVITDSDIDELAKISQSGTSFSLAACYMLLPLAPDKADCFDTENAQSSNKMVTEIEVIGNNSSEAVLGNNIPNPFSNTTVIPYYLPSGNNGTIQISSIQGKVLRSYPLQEGENKLEITTTGLENGIYFYSMVVNNVTIQNKKMIIIK